MTQVQVKDQMLEFEKLLEDHPKAMFGDDACELEHSFVPGAYIRKIRMPKGMVLTSKIHKTEHPYFVMTGDCTVATDEGVMRIQAPYSGITKPGTKRVLYMHEETIWVTVHPTQETDLQKIEEELIANSFEDLRIGEKRL